MKTRKILTTIAAFVAAATVLSAAVLAVSLPSTHTDVTPTIDTTAPENIISPAIPASDEKAMLTDISRVSSRCDHRHITSDYEWSHALDVLVEECRLAEVAKRECKHEIGIFYNDTDTGVCAAYCTFCGVIRELDEVPANAIVTNALTRANCVHDYSDWMYADATTHSKMCSKCSDYQVGMHNRVAATCTTNEVCTICGDRDPSWEMAYGHDMEYVVHWDLLHEYGYEDPENYYHEYRCVREDDTLRYICDYVPIIEQCDFTVRYWDPEENGTHDVYHVCSKCMIYWSEEHVVCPRAVYNGYCPKCLNPNPF